MSRLWLGAAALLAACGSLPMQTLDCALSGRCTPISFVLGQPDAASNINLYAGMSQPQDALVIGTTLFVAECRNNRILAWRNFPTTNQQPPDFVLGQPDLNTNLANYGGVSARSLSCPYSLAFAIDKKAGKMHLIVGDKGNGRILIWDGIPESSYQPANVVLGQTDFTGSSGSNRATTITITDPAVTSTDDGKLIAADLLNNRVLIWNDIPQQDDKPADLVVGQPGLTDDTANNPALMPLAPVNTAAWLSGPTGNPSADSNSLWIPDTNNDRILIFSPFPTKNGQAASQVLGQPNLSAIDTSQTVSAKSVNGPTGMVQKNNQMWVADQQNSRLLLWNLPLVNPPVPADVVLGQPDFVSSSRSVVSAATLNRPSGVFSDGTHLITPDTSNNRVLIYNLAGIRSGQDASLVLGQPDFSSNISNNTSKLDDSVLNAPFGVTGTDTQLMISDESNARLLLWTPLPQSRDDAPATVWGQPDFTHGQRNRGGVSDTALCTPAGIYTDGTRLFLADPCDHRVLMWNSIPTSPAQRADLIIGQPTPTSSGVNAGGSPSAHGLNAPLSATSDGHHLFVADTNNNRVLIWNSIPTQPGQDADLVLGQPNLTTVTPQPLDRNSLFTPAAVYSDGTSLIIADSGADRVLIFQTIPTQNQAPADIVLGQSDFVTNQHLRPPDPSSMLDPHAIFMHRGRLYIADRGNNRVLYWNKLPVINAQNADGVIGQPSATDYLGNNTGDSAHPKLTASNLLAPIGIFATPDMLFIADQGNNRVLALPNPPLE